MSLKIKYHFVMNEYSESFQSQNNGGTTVPQKTKYYADITEVV